MGMHAYNLSIASRIQRVAMQGLDGSNSYIAIKGDGESIHGLFQNAVAVPCDTLEDLMQALKEGAVDVAVVPTVNSLAQRVPKSQKLIIDYGFKIIGETDNPVDHCVIGIEGVDLSEVRFARSHPHALAQCSLWFARHPHIKPVPWFDTAGAARDISNEYEPNSVAIAPKIAARLYENLVVMEEGIQDASSNHTRFNVVARELYDYPVIGKFRSEIFITMRNGGQAAHDLAGRLQRELTAHSCPSLVPEYYFASYLSTPTFLFSIAAHHRHPGIEAAIRKVDPAFGKEKAAIREQTVIGCYPSNPNRRFG